MSPTRQRLSRHPKGNELVVHLFAVAGGAGEDAARDCLAAVWQACGYKLGMTAEIPGLGYPVEPSWPSQDSPETGITAARMDAGEGVHQAVLRRESDMWCLSLVLAPDPSEHVTWADLDSLCSQVIGEPSAAVIGIARLYLAHHPVAASSPSAPVPNSLRDQVPADPSAPVSWSERGAGTHEDFRVWDASAADDGGRERRLLIIGPAAHDRELSTWCWLGPGPDIPLPPLARYLLHVAKLRYQLRVWRADRASYMGLRHRADSAISDLLAASSRTGAVEEREDDFGIAATTARALNVLQSSELGLIDSLTRLREMRRTAEIAASNMESLGAVASGGVFASDHAVADWFVQQLDDDAVYVDGAVQRSSQIGALVDQMVQRGRQRRQESINLALTGGVGAILMALTAIQAFQYTVRVPVQEKPALVALLGSLALLASTVVVRLVAVRRRWSIALIQAAAGSVAASLAWLLVAIVAGTRARPGMTGAISGAALLAAIFISTCWMKLSRSRKSAG